MSKRSIAIRGRKTAVSMEGPFWAALKRSAVRRHLTLSALVEEIDAERIDAGTMNLSGAIRCFVLAELEAQLVAEGLDRPQAGPIGAPCEEAA